MGMPVRIDEELYAQAKSEAVAEHRTIAGQIEFWAKVGRTALTTQTCRKLHRRVAHLHEELRDSATPVRAAVAHEYEGKPAALGGSTSCTTMSPKM